MSTVPFVRLNSGTDIPQLGLGVFQISPADTAAAVETALSLGYRHVDTAQMYGNERAVGEAVNTSGVPRAEIYVTTKLNNCYHRPDDARRAFDQSLADLGFGYVDLFLIHWPLPMLYDGDFVSTWRTLEGFFRDGRARAIGVSNFQTHHLQRLLDETETVPAINQIEAHPYFANDEVRAFGERHGIVTQAWAPIAKGRVLNEPALVAVAAEVDRTPAQVALRWAIQRGDVVFPKTTRPERMKENFALFDFELRDQQMRTISGLDRGEAGRTGPHPDRFDYVP
jgi:2,5-diketo-D-gluconate reductase A